MNNNHYVIIMAGGIGSRFWPMSRTKYPKQFHDVLDRGNTLIEETFIRFTKFIPRQNIYIVTNQRYYNIVKEQLPRVNDDQILLEPVGRNTAPCIAYACNKIKKINPDAVFVVAASDHIILNEKKFQKDIETGLDACAKEEIIMTLGIKPTRPDTGYGYIQYLEETKKGEFYKVKTFVEKPNLELAKAFLASGDFVWNSGIFLFSGKTILKSFQQYLPEMNELFSEISDVYFTENENNVIRQSYSTCQNISIDYGIMEKAPNVYVIPTEFGWSDLGTWGSVYQNSEKDILGNAAKGNVMIYNGANNVISVDNKNKLVVINGLEGFIVVDTPDALLICKADEEQFIRQIVSDIKAKDGEKYV